MRRLLRALSLALFPAATLSAQCPTNQVTQPASQTVCGGGTTTAVNFSGGVSGTTYAWTNNQPGIGLAASGTGDIASFTAANTGSSAITANLTVTPQALGTTGFAYIPNLNSNNVSVINLATGATAATIPTAGTPFGTAVLPDRSRVYVSCVTGNRVEIINTATNSIPAHVPYDAPHGLVAAPDGSRVYVNGWGGSGGVSWINTSNNVSNFMSIVTNPEGMAISPDGSRLYVASATASGNLAIINTANNSRLLLGVGAFPNGVAISPDGSRVYVANNGSNTISVVNTATNSIAATINVGNGPLGVAISPDGSRVYVTNSTSNTVSIIDAATNTVLSSPATGTFPVGISVSPDGRRVYTANRNSNNVSVLDAVTGASLGTWAAGTNPYGLGNFLSATTTNCTGTPANFSITVDPLLEVNQPADQAVCGSVAATINFSGSASYFSWTNSNPAIGLAASGNGNISFTPVNNTSAPVTTTITVTPIAPVAGYVGNSNNNNVIVVNMLNGQTLATIPVGGGTRGMTLIPSLNRAYAVQTNNNRVAVINTSNNSLVGYADVGNAPFGAAALPDGSRVYVTNQNSNTVSVINTADNTVVSTIAVGSSPLGVVSNPAGTRVYVTNSTGNSLSIINTATNTVTNTVAIPAGTPYGVCVSPDGSRVYIACSGNGTVTVLDANTESIVTTILTGSLPFAIGINPAGTKVYVANFSSNTVSVINTATNTVAATIALPGSTNPNAISFSASGDRVYTVNRGNGSTSVIDGTTDVLLNTFTNSSLVTPISLGSFVLNPLTTCTGPSKSFTLTVEPARTASFSYPGTPYCATGTAMPTFSGTTGGTFSSTAGLSIDAATGVIDLAASTEGTYTVTYTLAAAGACPQLQTTASVVVAPTPVMDQPANQTVCAAGSTSAVNFTGTGGTVNYSWTSNNNSIGLGASGTGNIAGFTAVNNGNAPVTATITVTPQIAGSGTGAGRAYMASNTTNTVHVINTSTNTVSQTITVGSGPFNATPSPDGSLVYVANNIGNSVSVIETAGNTVIATVPVGNRPYGIAFTPDGTRALVASNSGNSVSVINTATHTVTNTIPVTAPWGVAVLPNGTKAYVSLYTTGSVAVINLATMTVEATITGLGVQPMGLVASADNSKVYIAISGSGQDRIAIIDVATNTFTTITGVVNRPSWVALSPDGSRLYTANQTGTGGITTINTATNTIVSTLPTGASSTTIGVAVSADGSRIYTANYQANTVSVIDAATNTLAATITGIARPSSQGLFLTSGNATPGCTGGTKTFTITVTPQPAATISYAGSPYCATGTATATLTGTTGGTYSSTTGLVLDATTGEIDLAASTAGTYTVTYTIAASGGCAQVQATAQVVINAAPQVDQPADQTICAGSNTTAVTFTGGGAGAVYNWTNSNTAIGLGASGAGDIAAFAATNATTSAISGTITVTPEANGCTGTAKTFTITVNPAPAATIAYTGSPFCATGTATPALTGTTGGTYSSTAGLSINATTGEIDLAASTPGTYTVTYTIAAANGCAQVQATTQVVIAPSAVVDQPADQTICAGAASTAVVFTGGSAGVTYNWTNNNTAIGLGASGTGDIAGFTATNTGSTPLVATITVTAQGGTSSSAPVPELLYYDFEGVNGTSVPNRASAAPSGTGTATMVGTQTIGSGLCSNALVGNGLTSANHYVNTNWAPNLGNGSWTISFKTANVPSTTTTFYVLGDVNSGSFRVFTGGVAGAGNWILRGALTDVTVPGGASTAASTTTFVYDAGANVIRAYLNGVLVNSVSQTTVNFSGTGPFKVGGYSSAGSFPAGSSLDEFRLYNRALTDAEVQSLNDCVSTSACNSAPKTFTITVNPQPAATISYAGSPYCATGTATPTLTGTTGGTYSSTTGLVIDATTGEIDLAASTAGTYTVAYTIAASGGCAQVQATAQVVINALPQVDQPSNETLCNGAATTAVTFTGGATGTVYNWTNNTTSIGLTASGTGDIASFTATNATASPVTATISVTPVLNGCSGSAKTFTITVNPTPTVTTVADQTLCNGAATSAVTFSGAVTGTAYAWTNSNTAIGLAASGTGDIASFTATNTTNAPISGTVTVTPSANNCTGTAQTFTITVNPTPTVNTVADQTRCNGAATTAVTFSGAVTGTSYAWTNSNPAIGLAASGNGDIASFTATNSTNAPISGTITVTPSANNCAGTAATFTITVNPTPTVNAVTSQTLCNGAATTAVTFSGAVTGTTYAWTNSNAAIGLGASGTGNIPSFTATNTTNAPISGIITVTPSANNCTGTAQTFTITVNPTPTVDAITSQTLCNGAATTAVTFSGAVTGTTYAWTNSNPAIGLAASGSGNIASFTATNTTNAPISGTITVTPSANNCTGTAQTFTYTVNPTPTVNAVTNQTLCNGAATAAVTLAGPVAGSSFAWTNSNAAIGLGASGTGNIPSFTATNSTNAPISGTITVTPSANNCTGTAQTFTYTVNPTPTVDAITSQTLCNGAATTAVTFSGAVTGTTFAWTNSNAAIGLGASGNGTIPSFTATNTTNAPITGTITVTPSANNCTGTAQTFTYTVNPTPTVNTITSQTLCNGAATTAVTLAGPVAGSSFAWTNSNPAIGLGASGTGNIPSFTATNTTNAPITGTITVTPSANNCTGTAQTFTITVNPTPTVDAITSQTLCNGAATTAVTFSGAVTGTTFAWTNSNPAIGLGASGNGTIPSFTATNTTNAPITGTITVTPSANNCTGTAQTFTYTVNPTPTVNTITSQTLCNGAASTAVTLAGPVAGSTFAWTNSNPAIGLGASGTGDIASFTATNTTNAPISGTITVTPSANNCTGTAQTFTITVNPTPTANAVANQTLCAEGITQAVALAGPVAGTTFAWTNNTPSIGLAASGTGNLPAFVAVNSTAAPVTATVSVTPSANNCTGTPITFTYTVNPLPTGTITTPQGTLVCQGFTTPLQVSGGVSYQWFLNGTAIPNATAATFNASQAGTYSVNITNSFGCTRAATNTVTLTLVQRPTAGFTFSTFCQNLPVQFTNTTNTTGAGTVTYQWSFGNGATSTQTSPTATYTTVGTYQVRLIASPNGCVALNDTVTQSISIVAPIAGRRLEPQNIRSGEATRIEARNFPNARYGWSPATGLSNPGIWYPLATLSQEQEYRITAVFPSGCVTIDTLLVRIFRQDDIFVPTAFSPNGDGVNDVLRPIMVGINSFRSFRIFDRLGRELFVSNSVNVGWDGTYRGQQLPAETYMWVAEGWDNAGKLIRKSGQVVLVR